MKTNRASNTLRAFTVWDFLIVLVAVVLAVLWFSLWQRQPARPRAKRINCVSNLKQIGLGFRMWANDHNDKFPWQASTNEGGFLELSGSLPAFRHFEITSNEWISPKAFVCPVDQQRTKATVWNSTTPGISFTGNSNLSYFIGLSASAGREEMILSGDRNISTNASMITGFLTVTSNSSVAWASGLHGRAGNIGWADGSAHQMNDALLTNYFQAQTNWPVRLLLP